MSSIVAVGAAVQVAKVGSRLINDWSERQTLGNIRELRHHGQVFAWLIYMVRFHYSEHREREHVTSAQVSGWVTDLGYEQVNRAAFTLKEVEGDGPCGGLALLFRKLPEGGLHTVKDLPTYVVAIRGTRAKKDDLYLDISIVRERLYKDEAIFSPVVELVSEIHEEDGSVDHVCIAGHSLGAHIAFLACRKLTLEEGCERLKCHLFNPPFISVDVVIRKALTGVVNGISEIPMLIDWRGGKHFIRDVGSFIEDIGDGTVRFFTFFKSSCRKKKKQMVSERATFGERHLRIHLYLNKRDTVSNGYLDFFSNGAKITTSTASCLSRGSRSLHLIDNAILHCSNAGDGTFEAHKLSQWTRSEWLEDFENS